MLTIQDQPGPIVIGQDPFPSRAAPVSSVRVYFDRAIDVKSFTTADVPYFEGPLGAIQVTGVQVTPNTGDTAFDIQFAAQTTTGYYTFLVGPDILDLDGNPMDQNFNFVPGESDDYFIGYFGVEGARITATRPSQNGSALPPLNSVRVTFNRAMNGDTFTADDVVFYGPPPGLISIDRVEEVAGSGGTQFDVIFATPQTELGAYTMFIGQDIYDIWGNPLDNNNNNLIAGEVEDSYTFSFNLANTRVLEDFESGNLSRYTAVGGSPSAQVTAGAAHDGLLGMSDADGGDWLYRNDVDARVSQGDIISVWVRTTLTDGRAYFGFGASATGTYSLVLAPNTGEFIIQNNPNYTFTNLAAVPQTYQANRWYRLEVTWGVGGNITGRLYDSDGTTLLNTVSANNNTITSGGIAFRAIFSNKDWDTVTAVPGAGPRPGSGQPGLDAPANAGSILAALPTLDGQVPLTAAVPQASPDHARGDLSAADAYAVSAALSEMSLDLTNREVRRAAVTTLFEQPITFEL